MKLEARVGNTFVNKGTPKIVSKPQGTEQSPTVLRSPAKTVIQDEKAIRRGNQDQEFRSTS